MSNEGQFGIVRILRPYDGFEAIYEPLDSRVPLMLTEVDPTQGPGGQALDPQAGTTGYDAQLVRGLSVPLGARVLLWVPRLSPAGLAAGVNYEWRIIWRLRSTFDYRVSRIPYHFPKQGEGVPDGAAARVPIPAAYETVVYNQAEVSTVSLTTVQHALREDVSFLPGPNLFEVPQNPAGVAGEIQQGIAVNTSTLAFPPAFLLYETIAKGDELLIALMRQPSTTPTWSFALAAADNEVSVFLGDGAADGPFPDIGVYVMTGAAG